MDHIKFASELGISIARAKFAAMFPDGPGERRQQEGQTLTTAQRNILMGIASPASVGQDIPQEEPDVASGPDGPITEDISTGGPAAHAAAPSRSDEA